jgi:hypothetical protein
MSEQFSRQEFYDLVWSNPLTQLAKRFGLSDVALHKICRKHDVPHPPLGWWAKKAAGKEVVQTPLPKRKQDISDTIKIVPGDLGKESSVLRAVREQARIAASASTANEPAPPHPIVEKTITTLQKAKHSDTGLVSTGSSGLITCQVASESLERLRSILNKLVAAAELQGFKLIKSEKGACFSGAEETISFSITETVKRVKHELTEKEKAEEEKWRLRVERNRSRNSWDSWFDRPKFPEWDYHCTGALSLEIEQVYVSEGQSPRKLFRDAKIQRLENMADEIAVGLAVTAAAKTARRLWLEERTRQEEENRKRREEAQRRKHISERRAKGLHEVLDDIDQIERLRRLITSLESRMSAGQHERVHEFLRWSRQHLEQREAALTPDILHQRFADQRLFGNDDDHGIYPRHW